MSLKYEDPGLVIDERGVLIRRYYFPFGLSRRIAWKRIREVREEKLGIFRGKYRIWGMDLKPWWFPLDISRPFKERCIVLEVGGSVCPAITPEDHEGALEVLRAGLELHRSG